MEKHIEGVINKIEREKEGGIIKYKTHIEFKNKDGKYCGFAVIYQELGNIDHPVKLTIKPSKE